MPPAPLRLKGPTGARVPARCTCAQRHGRASSALPPAPRADRILDEGHRCSKCKIEHRSLFLVSFCSVASRRALGAPWELLGGALVALRRLLEASGPRWVEGLWSPIEFPFGASPGPLWDLFWTRRAGVKPASRRLRGLLGPSRTSAGPRVRYSEYVLEACLAPFGGRWARPGPGPAGAAL